MATASQTPPIDVIIPEALGLDRPREPVLGGIPLSRGELRDGGWFTLVDEAKKAYVVEATPAAYWPDGSIKWLHLCGRVDLKGGEHNRFTLVRQSAASAASARKLRIEPDTDVDDRTAGRIQRVRGGQIDVDLAADVTDMLRVDAHEHHTILAPGLTPELVLTSPDGRRRRPTQFELDGNPEAIAAHDSRHVYRLFGRFLDEGAREVMQLRLFIEIRRDDPAVYLQPVVVFTGIPDEDLVESLTLTVHTRFRGEACRYGFGLERGLGYWDSVRPIEHGPRWPLARQVQLGSSFYHTDKRVTTDGSWVKAEEGQRAGGWCHLGDDTGGVTAAMRYYWQEYPRGLHIDADAGTIRFDLWPAAAEAMDLRRYSPTRYGATMYETGHGPFPKRTHGATGIAKSTELMLWLHGANDLEKKSIAHRGLTFTQPCRMQVPPTRFAASRVLGTIVDSETSPHRGIETIIERMMEFQIAERDFRGWFGQWDFGDLQMSYYNDQGQDRWAFDDGGYAWLNDEHIPSYGLWLAALRRVEPRWLEFAIAMSRHNRDVDTYQLGPFLGSGTRHNVKHWGDGDKEWRVVMPMARRLHYYMTADPWTAETIRTIAHKHREFARTHNTAPSTTGALGGQLALWEMTGDDADGTVVRNLADTFAGLVRDDGRWSFAVSYDMSTGIGTPAPDGKPQPDAYFFMNVFGGQHVLVEVAELLDHQGLRDALVRHADFVLEQLQTDEASHSGGFDGRGFDRSLFLAHAYWVTGEAKYRDRVKRSLDGQHDFEPIELGGDGPLDEPRHVSAGKQWARRNKMLCGFANATLLGPYAATVLEAQK